AFTEHLARIADAGVRPALVSEIDFSHPGRHFLLTFDDGGKSAAKAAELLERRGWRGHFFIVTSLIGSRTFLDAAGIRALSAAGHAIGSHSHTHPGIFPDQQPAGMVEAWRVSADLLSQLTGLPCLMASVPGGDISGKVLESADTAGLRTLFTSEPWLAPRRVGGCTVLGRFSVKVSTTGTRVGELARFRGWGSALVKRRLKVWATLALPAVYRLYIRARANPSAGTPAVNDRTRSPNP